MSIESFPRDQEVGELPKWAEALKEHLNELKTLSRKKLKGEIGSLNLQGIESFERSYQGGVIDELEYLKTVRSFLDDSGYWDKLLGREEGKELVDKIFQDVIERDKKEKLIRDEYE